MEELGQLYQQAADNEESLKGKYLTFFIDSQIYGIPIADVVQIVGVQDITEIPEFPVYAKGIINLRGTIIPVIDMRIRLGKMEIPYDDKTCIIVTSIGGRLIGLAVDSVDEVTYISDEEISPPPKLPDVDTESRFITGVGLHNDKITLLLDSQKILGEEEISLIIN